MQTLASTPAPEETPSSRGGLTGVAPRVDRAVDTLGSMGGSDREPAVVWGKRGCFHAVWTGTTFLQRTHTSGEWKDPEDLHVGCCVLSQVGLRRRRVQTWGTGNGAVAAVLGRSGDGTSERSVTGSRGVMGFRLGNKVEPPKCLVPPCHRGLLRSHQEPRSITHVGDSRFF